MRILHTSDWHVGRTIRGRSRIGEHRSVLAEIAELAAGEQADLVVVAGDLFDHDTPSPDAEAVVYRALLDLTATGAEVVVVVGNHDNPRRWNAVRPLLETTANLHLAADLRRPDQGGVLDLTMASGERARIALVPFLNRRAIVRGEQLMGQDEAGREAHYAERARRIVAGLTTGFGDGTAVDLLVAHLTVASGTVETGGGERAAHTVLDYVVPPQVFSDALHYVALGHLHLPHRVPGPTAIWYSGSPLVLDFGEKETDAKAVLRIDVSVDTPAIVEPLPLRSGTALRTLRGTVDQVVALAEVSGDAHLRVQITEAARPGLADEIRELIPNAVDVRLAGPEDETDDDRDDLESLYGSPVELFGEYLGEQGLVADELVALFDQLLEELEDTGAPDAA